MDSCLDESGGQLEKRWSKRDLIFPILAGVSFGILHVLRKMGLNGIPVPIAGFTMQNASDLVFFPLLILAQRSRHPLVLDDKRAWVIFSLAGLAMFIAQLCVFSALDLGQISPLSSLSPFFVLPLVRIFLRGLEKTTWRIVLGVILCIGICFFRAAKPHDIKSRSDFISLESGLNERRRTGMWSHSF